MDAVLPDGVARIGPNAITRVAEALRAAMDEATTARLFDRAGLGAYLQTPPGAMVDEREVTALHAALRETLGEAEARRIGWEAGRRTADYLLANRIPKPVQVVLKLLPPGPAARILLGAIGNHAWTFAGSGQFRVEHGRPLRLVIEGCPICRGAKTEGPVCDFYAATFERLFQVLVSRRTLAVQTACESQGDPACVFELRW